MSDNHVKKDKERRQSERVYHHGHAEVMRDTNQAACSVQIMNLSEGGVRFVAQEPFEIGETFRIELEDGARCCKTLHCKELFKGYAVRSRFEE